MNTVGARVSESEVWRWLAAVPDPWQHNLWVLQAKAHEALWVTGDFERAETYLADCRPRDDYEAFIVGLNRGHVFRFVGVATGPRTRATSAPRSRTPRASSTGLDPATQDLARQRALGRRRRS